MNIAAVALFGSTITLILISNIIYTSFNNNYYLEFYNNNYFFYEMSQEIIRYIQTGSPLDSKYFSNQAVVHMTDVKSLFNLAILTKTISILITITAAIYLIKQNKKRMIAKSLSLSISTTLLLAVLIGIFSLLNFDIFFIKFHQMLFKNDLWIFDANDNLIKIFPQSFFVFITGKIFLNIIITNLALLFLVKLFIKNDNTTS